MVALPIILLLGLSGVLANNAKNKEAHLLQTTTLSHNTQTPAPDTQELHAEPGEVLDISMELAKERAEFIDTAKLRGILEEMARGEHHAIFKKLNAHKTKFGKNPHYHYYRGLAYLASRKYKEGLGAYAKAIKLDPRYARDRKLIEDVEGELISKSKKRRLAARRLIKKSLKDSFVPRAAALAIGHKYKRVRVMGIKVLKDADALDDLPRWQQLALDLRAAHGCDEHRKIVLKMDQDGSHELLPHLERLQKTQRKGCGLFKRDDCYACLRDDLNRVVDDFKKTAQN